MTKKDFPEEFDLHDVLLSLWIRQAVYHEGTLKVSNGRDSYVVVNKGKYTFCDEGHIKKEKKRPEAIERILRGLILKYGRLEKNSYHYFYDKDRWIRKKVK